MREVLWKKAERVLSNNGIIVAPTDTIFGILGSAFSKKAVSRMYDLKERDLDKPFIILITRKESLKDFGITEYEKYVSYFRPKTSVILSVKEMRWQYLHRRKESLAFRLIGKRNKNLYLLIEKTGPLVAPSANPEGKSPAMNMTQAKAYFGSRVDLYIPWYPKNTKPSTIISLVTGSPEILRK